MRPSIKEEILAHYLDADELVTRVRDPQSRWTGGNQLLDTAVFYVCLYLTKQLTLEDIARFSRAIEACYVLGHPGLLNRNPMRPDQNGWDDYHIAAASLFLNTAHAGDILAFGQNNHWFFNNEHPGKLSFSSFLGRYPGFIGYLKLCANQSPGPLQAFLLGASILLNARKADADQKIMTWLRVLVAKEVMQANCYEPIQIWEASLAKQYGSMKNVFRASYPKDHPMAEFDV